MDDYFFPTFIALLLGFLSPLAVTVQTKNIRNMLLVSILTCIFSVISFFLHLQFVGGLEILGIGAIYLGALIFFLIEVYILFVYCHRRRL